MLDDIEWEIFSREMDVRRAIGWVQWKGMRLDVPSGQSIRFEAGDERDVDLVELSGSRRVIGFNKLVDGGLPR